MSEHILSEVRGGLGILTLDRPRALNSLDDGMVLAMERVLRDWAEAPEVRAVVVRGGPRGLCAGGDVRALFTGSDADAVRFWADEYRLNALIGAYPKPYLPLMDGITMGGGLGISAHAPAASGSLRIVTERTLVAMPETRIGFTPDVGMPLLLANAPGELGTHLCLTSGQAGGADAIHLGWADVMVPSERLDELVDALTEATDAASWEPGAAHDVVASFAIEPPPAPLAEQRAWIDDAYAGDSALAIVARLEELSAADGPAGPSVAGAAAAALAELRTVCPFSVAVTLAALRSASKLGSLEAVLAQDLALGTALIARSDFREGVRALLIEKDGAPTWNPSRIEDVDPVEVEAAFATRPLT
ncbi:enoyl-CoA hydratase/isomerase family protein [Sinomonas sp. JGH33]|uniref:3-hydroxyisobutyryl-CoA hydrolase n=1 Tax=Sinomonas terricola TaxID=3110330 RepID=A0ABU5T7Z1_9MICC|nr:enoyl-CoA hydratase/isomerase family protein [Sinomonas sp. JGH33]MEA5455660.1 enoyl-CoA hydratase/isomerase family protein [Sinomonas sp. JGH33]